MATKILIAVQSTDLDTIDIHDLFIAQNQLGVIVNGYADRKLDPPDWVSDKLADVTREIDFRLRAELQRRLKNAQSRRSALRTADEKRKDLDVEIAELEGRLGKL